MEVIRFALGLRFDPVGVRTYSDEASAIISKLLSKIDGKLLFGMKLYTGHCKLDEFDSAEILTVVFMGQGLSRTRALYDALQNCSDIIDMLTERRPIIQTNAVAKLEGLDYCGEFDKKGALSGGEKMLSIIKTDVAEPYAPKSVVLLAPDKFKGTLDQFEVIEVLKRAASDSKGCYKLLSVPAADGGDGTARALASALNGHKCFCDVSDPLGGTINAEYYFVDDYTALIEMASASGLTLVEPPFDPMRINSKGTGELILAAAKAGAKHILLGVGGSATNDGGIGAASALGVRFWDENGMELEAIPLNLNRIASIDTDSIAPELGGVEITVLCDVDNPLTGENGATAVFGPQKHIDDGLLIELENGMKNLERLYDARMGRDFCKGAGMGAAGGIGAMLASLFGAKLTEGAEFVLDALGFNAKLKTADFVITGEGRFDGTSRVKAVGAIIARAVAAGKPVKVITGCTGDDGDRVFDGGDVEVIAASEAPLSGETAKDEAKSRLFCAALSVFDSIQC